MLCCSVGGGIVGHQTRDRVVLCLLCGDGVSVRHIRVLCQNVYTYYQTFINHWVWVATPL